MQNAQDTDAAIEIKLIPIGEERVEASILTDYKITHGHKFIYMNAQSVCFNVSNLYGGVRINTILISIRHLNAKKRVKRI